MDQGRGVLTNKQSSSAPTHVCHPPSSLYYLEGSHEFPLNWDTAPCRVGRFVRSRPNNIQAVLAAGSLTGRLPLSRQPLKRLFRRRNPQRVGPETYLASRILRLEVALGANSPAVKTNGDLQLPAQLPVSSAARVQRGADPRARARAVPASLQSLSGCRGYAADRRPARRRPCDRFLLEMVTFNGVPMCWYVPPSTRGGGRRCPLSLWTTLDVGLYSP